MPDARRTAFAVMLMDLDRFKEINDTLGHDYGDLLLTSSGRGSASASVRAGLVARLGGDEFAVLPRARATIGRASSSCSRRGCSPAPSSRSSVDELSLEVGASIGIARFPQDGDDAHTLLRRADVAMYAAKDATRAASGCTPPSQDHHSMPPAQRRSATSAARSAPARSSFTTSRSSSSTSCASAAPRGSSAGSIPSAGCCRRARSCRRSSRPA